MSEELCQICKNAKFKYSCPKCNVLYCSISCYKSQMHIKCSEQFYRACVQEELEYSQKSSVTLRNIYEILKRTHTPECDDNLDSQLAIDEHALDSDDEEKYDLESRIRGIDINDSDQIWQRLNAEEKREFEEMVSNGDIMKLIPDFEPWWCTCKSSKIIEIPDKSDNIKLDSKNQKIYENIPKFSSILNKKPSQCLNYNLINILAAYTCTVRFFNGEHETNPIDAASHLINISANLKSNANFDDAQQPIVSVQMESLTKNIGVGSENRKQMKNDVEQIMILKTQILYALSDIYNIFWLAKSKIKRRSHSNSKKQSDEGCDSTELNKTELKYLIKKIEFFLSYVMYDYENTSLQEELLSKE